MKKIYALAFFIFPLFFQSALCAQNVNELQDHITISGDTCPAALLTVHPNKGFPKMIKWYKDSLLYQVRTTYEANGEIVAGGNGEGSEQNQLNYPQGVFVDRHGNIYVVDEGRQRVQKWTPGAATGKTVAGGNGKGSAANQLFTPNDVCVDKDGNVYITDGGLARVQKWAPGAQSGITVAGGHGEGNAANQLFGPIGITIDDDGNLYIADRWNDRVQKWAPGATSGTTVAGGNGRGSAANQLYEASDVCVDKTGNVYVADNYNPRVQKWAPGAVTGETVAGGSVHGNGVDQLSQATVITIDGDGNLYVLDGTNYRIQKFPPGELTGITVAGGHGYGNASNQLNSSFGIAVDKDANIYMSELFNESVKKFSFSKKADSTITAFDAGKYYAVVSFGNGNEVKSHRHFVRAIPGQPKKIFGDFEISAGATTVFHIERVCHLCNYTWTVPGGVTINSGQGTTDLDVTWGNFGGRLKVSAGNTCGVSEQKGKTVYVTGSIMSAEKIITNITSENIKVYPNPVQKKAILSIIATSNIKYAFQINDINGKILLQKEEILHTGINTINLDLSNFAKGIYLLNVSAPEQNKKSIRLIKD